MKLIEKKEQGLQVDIWKVYLVMSIEEYVNGDWLSYCIVGHETADGALGMVKRQTGREVGSVEYLGIAEIPYGVIPYMGDMQP